MIDLTGSVALITGSSRGIGRATALRLAQAGAEVVVNYVSSQAPAREVAEQIQKLGRRAAIVKADVTEPEDVRAMVDFVGERFGRLDLLVSNAASGGFRPLMDASERNFDAAMHTNVRATLSLVQAAHKLLARGEGAPGKARAKVVALSSHGSHQALPAYGLIGASKAALESLIRHLALELGGQGINFNVVLAGLVETDSTRSLPDAAKFFAGFQQQMMTGSRPLTAADVADAVLFLCSPLADLVQGQTLVVDGGAGIRG
ncbi:MAG TPA: SDR family oxidoreductase [Pirellulales bacterium]|nr:SDR family oxidoreductase [Pirellulales bacterium]